MTRDDIITSALTYVGTPYHSEGRVKGIGLDCVGLIIGVSQDVIKEPKDLVKYLRRPAGAFMVRSLRRQCFEVQCPQPGDIVVFWMDKIRKHPQHIGIKTYDGLVHCSPTKVVHHTWAQFWDERLVASFEFPGVEKWLHLPSAP